MQVFTKSHRSLRVSLKLDICIVLNRKVKSEYCFMAITELPIF